MTSPTLRRLSQGVSQAAFLLETPGKTSGLSGRLAAARTRGASSLPPPAGWSDPLPHLRAACLPLKGPNEYIDPSCEAQATSSPEHPQLKHTGHDLFRTWDRQVHRFLGWGHGHFGVPVKRAAISTMQLHLAGDFSTWNELRDSTRETLSSSYTSRAERSGGACLVCQFSHKT